MEDFYYIYISINIIKMEDLILDEKEKSITLDSDGNLSDEVKEELIKLSEEGYKKIIITYPMQCDVYMQNHSMRLDQFIISNFRCN